MLNPSPKPLKHRPVPRMMANIRQRVNRVIIPFDEWGWSFRTTLVWVKQHFVIERADYQYKHEPILYGWLQDGPHYFTKDRTQTSVFEVDKPHISDLHHYQARRAN